MAELLEKLFTWQYFEPVLFTSIGVLLLLLFIVLFLGKKDQKKKLEETKKLEISSLTEENSVDAFAKADTPEVAVEVAEEKPTVVADQIPEQPVMNMDTSSEEELPKVPDFEVFGSKSSAESTIEFPENIISEDSNAVEDKEENNIPEIVKLENDVPEEKDEQDPISFVDDVVKSSVIPEEMTVAEDQTDKKIQEFKNNFADLASSINKELDEINKMQESMKTSKDTKEELPLPDEVDVTPINEATKFTPSSVFSSVYSPSKEKEITEDNPIAKEDLSVPKEEIKNDIKFEMPIKKEEMELPKVNKEPINVPDFSSFDNESFDIK